MLTDILCIIIYIKKRDKLMELKDFIKESLVQVNLAIEESNKELKDSTAVINPNNFVVYSEGSQVYGRKSTDLKHQAKVVHKIEFDVAVYAESDEQKSGGAKISIASIGLGVKAQEGTSNKSESRLKFSIPVIYPENK